MALVQILFMKIRNLVHYADFNTRLGAHQSLVQVHTDSVAADLLNTNFPDLASAEVFTMILTGSYLYRGSVL